MKKYLLFIIICASLLPINTAHAQRDSRCWTKTACVKFITETFGVPEKQAQDGFYSAKIHEDAKSACKGDTDPTTKDEFGFCPPVGKAETRISFGNTNKFDNLGTFIQYIYRYGFIIGSIVAVFMVMLAGVMWIFSGGNQDMIGKARKRIGNAVIGLVLFALSYTILNMLNPYLVNLRMPDVWLVNTQETLTAYCNDMATGTKINLVGNANDKVTDKQIEAASLKAFTLDAKKAACGKQYVSQNGGGQTCQGNLCDFNEACVPFDVQNGKKINNPTCMKGDVIVYYHVTDPITKLIQGVPGIGVATPQLEDEWLDKGTDGDPNIIAICDNGINKKLGVNETWDDENNWSCGAETWKLTTIDGTPKEYLLQINNITGENGDQCLGQKQSHWCGSDKIVGYTVQFEVAENWDTDDPFIYTGMSGVGKWNTHVTVDSLLNWDKQKIPDCTGTHCMTGIFVDGAIGQSNFVPIAKCPTQDPNECCDGTNKEGKIVTPIGYCAEKGGGN